MENSAFDKRETPARPDLAAAHLRETVKAERYVDGQPATIVARVAELRPRPDSSASLDTQALFGERTVVYERKDGWAWLQLVNDNYVGYVREEDIRMGGWRETTHRVAALRAPVFSRADLKSPLNGYLPLNADLAVQERAGGFASVGPGMWLSERHIREVTNFAPDWVAEAERIVGAPYVWGGKTPDGLDCSGLIQISRQASGRSCPRDTDMQERDWAAARRTGEGFRRGDLVFWKGHVGVMRNESELLHANAHHMCVAVEPVADAIARIAAKGTPVSSVVRLGPGLV